MRNDAKDKKNIRFIIIIIILFIIYMIVAFFLVNRSDNTTTDYLIVGNNLIWHENDGKWYQLNDYTDEVGSNNYWVYDGTNVSKASSAQYTNYKWYFFDENYNQISSDNFRAAYSGDEQMVLANYRISNYESSDDEIISEATGETDNTRLDLYQTSLQKIEYDFDNDGQLETIYTFSDYVLDVVNYKPKNYLVLVKNNKVMDVIKTDENNVLNFVEVLDVDFDDEYELVISQRIVNLPTFDSCYQIYKIENNKLKRVQNCLYEE